MKKLFFLIAVLIIVSAIVVPCYAESKVKDAKQLMDHLYRPDGQEPVRDAIIDAEKIMEVSEGPFALSTVKIKVTQDKMFFLAPNKFRADVQDTNPNSPLYGQTRTIIRNGKFVYTFIAFGEAPAKMEIDKPENTNYLPYYLQKYPITNEYKYIYLGQEKINDQVLEVVGLYNPANYVDYKTNLTKVWIDAKKWVPYKIEYTRYATKDKKDTYIKRVYYQDVRQLDDGRWWPFKITIEEFNKDSKGKFVFESAMIYKRVAVNTGLQEELFKPMIKFLK